MGRFPLLVGLLLLGLPIAAAAEPKGSPGSTGTAAPRPVREATEPGRPHIERVMPFSSCSPGGAVLLQGRNFGATPGRLRLHGHFPRSGQLDLQQLEWGGSAVGGKVPMVEGALDQPVRLQVVTKTGKVSNTIPCEFKATRVEIVLPGASYSRAIVDMGDNRWSGNDFYDADDHQLLGDVSSGYFIPYHKSDKPLTDGDNNGKDVFETRQLENGWVISRHTWGDWNSDGGEILSRTGFQPGGSKATMSVRWRTGTSDVVHYSFVVYAEGPIGVPLHERVELPKPPVEDLADWNPIAPKGNVLLRILSPPSTVTVGNTPIRLAIDAENPQPGWEVQLEWARIGTSRDASLGGEAWNVGKPSGAPKLVRWTALPLNLPTTGFEVGDYAVRARLRGQDDSSWTDWRRFTLAPGFAQAAPPSGASAAAVPRGVSGTAAMRPVGNATPAVPPSQTRVAALPKPKLVLDALAAQPTGAPSTESPFGVRGLKVRNTGTADAKASQFGLKLRCVPLAGGQCSAVEPPPRVPGLPAGATRPLGLEAAFQAGVPGRYRLEVTLDVPGQGRETNWSREVTVAAPKPRLNKIPRPPGSRP